jgi:type I restriction enzyme S subunit
MSAIIDYCGKSPTKTIWGVPLVTAKIIKGGKIKPPDEFIAEEDYDSWMQRGLSQKGDVVMTTEAPLGEIAQLDGSKVALAQCVITLRGKPDLLYNTFLKFLLQSQPVQEALCSRATGTTVLGIRQSELRKVPLTFLALPEQKAIARILGTLDDKIELNRRMNATLEAMARALFQSWFVDFDPVHTKAAGHQPSGMSEKTAALFPSSFQDSELGEIPKGWGVGTLTDIANNHRRSVQPNEIASNTPYIALEHMPRRSIALGDWEPPAQVESGKTAFSQGEILFGKLRPYFHKVGVAPVFGVCSTDILVLAPAKSDWFGFLLGHVSSDSVIQFADKLDRPARGNLAEFRALE